MHPSQHLATQQQKLVQQHAADTDRGLFIAHVDGVMIKDTRASLNKGLALESERFKDEREANLKRRVRPAKLGRPIKPVDDESKQKSLL